MAKEVSARKTTFLKPKNKYFSVLTTVELESYVVCRTVWTETILLVSGRLVVN